jgi:SNF2 family DNA or RNA helicase
MFHNPEGKRLTCRWKNEIESKTAAGLFKVMIYHGQNRSKSKNALRNADVVLTTYGTLTAESGIEVGPNKPNQVEDQGRLAVKGNQKEAP